MVTAPPAGTVVIGAPASGSGKTILATGLMAALHAQGVDVAPSKVGPDYIDPGYHALAAGRPGRNLDAVMCGEELVPRLHAHGAAGADIAVVEGVMGLFDGRIDPHGVGPAVAEGSTAHVARLLDAPVVMVVDTRGHGQSIAATLHGFATWDAGTRVGGVILNRVGSARHEQVLGAACAAVGLPVLGAVPRLAAVDVPSRHLGLITAVEGGGAAVDAVGAMGELVARHVDLAAVRSLAATAGRPGPQVRAWDPAAELSGAGAGGIAATAAVRPRIAVAGGPAFTFGYAEYPELLQAAGAEVVVVDPRTDDLPADIRGLVLPGGFPEVHAEALAANAPMLAAVRRLAASGAPIHAECAGMLYLARSLEGHAMAGVIDVDARFGSRLTLGYRDAVAPGPSVLFAEGTRVTGHEFHRTELHGPALDDGSTNPAGARRPAWTWRGPDGLVVSDGLVAGPDGNVHASYLHTHPAAVPGLVAGLVAAAQ